MISRIFVLTLLIVGCESATDSLVRNQSNYMLRRIDLGDLYNSKILEYISENKLESTRSIIYVGLNEGTYRSKLLITQIRTKRSLQSVSHYSKVNGHLVLIATDVDKYLQSNLLNKELWNLIKSMDIKLVEDKYSTYHPSIWRVITCGDTLLMQDNMALYEVPCGYKLTRRKDSFDSLLLVRE